MSLQIVTVKEI